VNSKPIPFRRGGGGDIHSGDLDFRAVLKPREQNNDHGGSECAPKLRRGGSSAGSDGRDKLLRTASRIKRSMERVMIMFLVLEIGRIERSFPAMVTVKYAQPPVSPD
jgi:hypothetical protein